MPNNQSKNFHTYTKKQKDVLDLEKKYFDILFKIFSQQSFKNELRAIMNDININWDRVHTLWGKTNVVDLAVERHINFRVYNDPLIKNLIKSVYPSVISSDTAFVTNDAVINIDSKTVSVNGNAEDWDRQSLGCNQFSFDNKRNFIAPTKGVPVPVTALLKPYHKEKPVLSYFLSTLYLNDEDNQKDSWYEDSKHKIKPYYEKSKRKDKTDVRPEFLDNIKFSCVPHNEISGLFDNNIIDGNKGYKPPNVPIPTGTSSSRITHECLKERYDSKGVPWVGFKSWAI
tara:strand:- start:1 stop:855 length:855 start_codon:yes stop_codon:yes gene_type:complete